MPKTRESKIRKYIIATFLFGEGGDDLRDDESLLAKGIVDSTGVLEIVAFLTETYGIQVEDEELIPDNFDTISKLAAYVVRKQARVESTLTATE